MLRHDPEAGRKGRRSRRRGGLCRARRGGALAEFAISAPILLLALLGTIEFGIEVFVRHAAERGASAAAQAYTGGRTVAEAEDAAAAAMPAFLSDCIEPLEVRLFNSIGGRDLVAKSAGHPPTGTSADDSAVVARVALVCEWARLTPPVRAALGARIRHSATEIRRIPG